MPIEVSITPLSLSGHTNSLCELIRYIGDAISYDLKKFFENTCLNRHLFVSNSFRPVQTISAKLLQTPFPEQSIRIVRTLLKPRGFDGEEFVSEIRYNIREDRENGETLVEFLLEYQP